MTAKDTLWRSDDREERVFFATELFPVDSLKAPIEGRSYKYMHHALFAAGVLKMLFCQTQSVFFLLLFFVDGCRTPQPPLPPLSGARWDAASCLFGVCLSCVTQTDALLSPHSSSGPALVGVVREDWTSSNSIALSWSQVGQPPSDILDYEVKYYEKVRAPCRPPLS